MDRYIGVKIIHAEKAAAPKDMGSYKTGDDGYAVVYEDGYASWSPKAVFEEAYRMTDGLSFGLAVEALKKGFKVRRKGWNGKGMWLCYIPAGNAMFKGYNMQDCIGMKTADNKMQPGWLASQTDILADDWQIVD